MEVEGYRIKFKEIDPLQFNQLCNAGSGEEYGCSMNCFVLGMQGSNFRCRYAIIQYW